jgi:hypothetical protein
VAVHDTRLSPWGRHEKALVESGQPYLRGVWHNEHWTLYAVERATRIVDAPATVVSADASQIVLTAPRGRRIHVRIRWFRCTKLDTASGGCIERSGDQVLLRTGSGRGRARFVISSSVSRDDRGHC